MEEKNKPDQKYFDLVDKEQLKQATVEKAIEMENDTASVEHISHWLDKYDGKYAASPCSCRRSRQTHGEACGDDPEGWCIAVGDMADYVVETNKSGRYITKEEALKIFKQAEDNGFVHQITNIDGKTVYDIPIAQYLLNPL